jgi:hypothetical protein
LFSACVPPATAACGVTQKRCARPEVGMSFTHANDGREIRPKTEVRARMKVLIGVDPHKRSVAVAVVDESVGEFVERATFPQNRSGLRALERWAKRFPERRWAVENAGGLGVGTWQGGWQRPASRWWTCRPSSRHGCGCSRPATLARTMGSMPLPPRWPPRATNGWQRSIPRPARRCCASFPRGAKTWWPSVPERSTASTGSCGTSSPAGYRVYALDPPSRAYRARHTSTGRLGPPPPAVGFGDPARRPDAGAKDR